MSRQFAYSGGAAEVKRFCGRKKRLSERTFASAGRAVEPWVRARDSRALRPRSSERNGSGVAGIAKPSSHGCKLHVPLPTWVGTFANESTVFLSFVGELSEGR